MFAEFKDMFKFAKILNRFPQKAILAEFQVPELSKQYSTVTPGAWTENTFTTCSNDSNVT